MENDSSQKAVPQFIDKIGKVLVGAFHYLALFAIGGTIIWAGTTTFAGMIAEQHAGVDDVLLLFIYLELGAMVGIYFHTNHMPVRFLIYVAITALTRMMIGDIQDHHKPDLGIIYISASILLLAVSVLIVRFASYRYPTGTHINRSSSQPKENGRNAGER